MQLFKKLKQEKKQKDEKLKNKEEELKLREEDITKWLKDYKTEENFGEINIKEFYIQNSKTFYYIESYLKKDESSLLQKIINGQEEEKWVHLHHSNRKLQKWGGNVTPEGLKDIEKIPEWLDILAERLDSNRITDKEHYCNHYLINHYQGASGIMPHTDGPLYHPYVTVVSLGSPIIFKIFENFDKFKQEEEMASIIVEGGSLLVFCDEYYNDFLHCIQDHKIESVRVEYRIIEDSEGARVEFGESSVLNFRMSRLFKEGFLNFEREEGFKNKEEIEGYLRGMKIKDFDLDFEIFEEKLTVFITWERKERISLTIRHVTPAG